MAQDLLSIIRGEIDTRLKEIRPLMAEYEQLLVAIDALAREDQRSAPVIPAPKPRAARGRGPAKRASTTTKRASTTPKRPSVAGKPASAAPKRPSTTSKPKQTASAKASSEPRASASASDGSKPARAARGAAREAILAALDHGSHTASELVVVTAMSSANVNGNLRKMLADGEVTRTGREGKTAWALAGATS
jgi:hypothetical protein